MEVPVISVWRSNRFMTSVFDFAGHTYCKYLLESVLGCTLKGEDTAEYIELIRKALSFISI